MPVTQTGRISLFRGVARSRKHSVPGYAMLECLGSHRNDISIMAFLQSYESNIGEL